MRQERRTYFMNLLEAERRRAADTITLIRRTVPEHFEEALAPGEEGDAGTVGAATADDEAIETRTAIAVGELDAAIKLLRNTPEQYGVCVRCGEAIPESRLEIMPATRFCRRHANGSSA